MQVPQKQRTSALAHLIIESATLDSKKQELCSFVKDYAKMEQNSSRDSAMHKAIRQKIFDVCVGKGIVQDKLPGEEGFQKDAKSLYLPTKYKEILDDCINDCMSMARVVYVIHRRSFKRIIVDAAIRTIHDID